MYHIQQNDENVPMAIFMAIFALTWQNDMTLIIVYDTFYHYQKIKTKYSPGKGNFHKLTCTCQANQYNTYFFC